MNEMIFDEVQTIPLVAHDAAQERMARIVCMLVVFATVEALAIAGLAASVMF